MKLPFALPKDGGTDVFAVMRSATTRSSGSVIGAPGKAEHYEVLFQAVFINSPDLQSVVERELALR